MSVDLESQPVAADHMADFANYRAMSAAAVVSCVLGGFGAFAFLSPYFAALGVIGAIVAVYAWRKIRVNRDELTGEGVAKLGLALSLGISGLALAYHGTIYATEVPEGFERVSYQRLQPDVNVPGEIIPPSVVELDGKKIFIKGYIYPQAKSEDLKEFVIVRDNGDCCFGGRQPKLTDMILVKLAEPLTIDYSTRLHALAGTFHVAQGAVGGLGLVVYHLDATYIQ